MTGDGADPPGPQRSKRTGSQSLASNDTPASEDGSGPFSIREEEASDLPEILTVVERAFGSRAESELVRMIRESPNYVAGLSLVSEEKGQIIGHIMLSYVDLDDGATSRRILTLSPVSVIPSAQRKGVGSALIGTALELADDRGEPLVCLEGAPEFYGRLGFQDSRDAGIYFDLPEWAPRNAGQIYKLRNYNPAIKGKVNYPQAFGSAEALRKQLEER